MKGVNYFIIKTDNRYNNTVDVEGKNLIINTEITEKDYEFVNRIATVVATPSRTTTSIVPGDRIIVHHNIFRRWFDVHGRERNGANYIDEDMYCASADQVYAYNDGSGWKPTENYCFVEPVMEKKHTWSTSNELLEVGTMVYSPEEFKGLTVGFSPDSEYEFNIEGRKLYRVELNQITWTSKKNAKELLKAPTSL